MNESYVVIVRNGQDAIVSVVGAWDGEQQARVGLGFEAEQLERTYPKTVKRRETTDGTRVDFERDGRTLAYLTIHQLEPPF